MTLSRFEYFEDDFRGRLVSGVTLRESIRHHIVLPNFDIAADAASNFKERMTRHKSTVDELLSNNYE
ncbi:calcium-binding protein [Medicago truncatula]|uniref:Calcium-binding protein n=1 Tax=Medicago truncatula TaxID=3880 RepID=G7JJH2_MEDTR|nr:calcium-binding protein [Medicago truncatula]